MAKPTLSKSPLLVAIGLLLPTTSLLAAPALFTQTSPTNQTLPPNAKPGVAVAGVLNAKVLDGRALQIALPDGTVVEAQRTHLVRDDARYGLLTWSGSIGNGEGDVFITRFKGALTGTVTYQGKLYEILPSRSGKHVLFAVDMVKASLPDKLRVPKISASDEPVRMAEVTGTPIVQDVMVLYTARTLARYGSAATVESMIVNALQKSNQAYVTSQVSIILNPAFIGLSEVVEGVDMNATLTAFESNAQAANLRNQYAADLNILLTEDGGYCGLANLMTSNSTSFAPYAYGIVASGCLSNLSLPHELGHQQGLAHDRDNSSGWGGVYPYSYGYRVCNQPDGSGFRDIMSYSCTGAPRVLIMSNPNIYYNGHPAGIDYDLNPAAAADNARSLNNTAATVAAFRVKATATPAAPSSLTASSVAHNQVSLSWSDNATNEAGYKVERSPDGVVYQEIAALGASVRSFIDNTVAANSRYFYRVYAFNSMGASGFSNALSVTTPDVPPPAPPAPSTVTAANNANGTATVGWSAPASGTVTGYDILRETYNSRKGTWGAATLVASVGSTTFSLVNSTGNGTFRFSVRAKNAGGASPYAGPVSVTVTGAPKGRK